MKSISFCCFVAASFAGVLNAFRVGDLVRLKGLKVDRQHDGKIGLVKSLLPNDRVTVKTFNDDEFTAPAQDSQLRNFPSFFSEFNVVPEKLELIKPEDWKPEINLLFSNKEMTEDDLACSNQIFEAHLSAEQIHRLGITSTRFAEIEDAFGSFDNMVEPSEELAIIGVWMNQTFQTSFLTSFPQF